MSFAKHGLTAQSVDLGKSVLGLSALGILGKLLHVDLSRLQFLGADLGPTTSSLVPGFLGLILAYAFVAFVVSRSESAIENVTTKETLEAYKKVTDSRVLTVIAVLVLPFSVFVYSMPYVVGVFTLTLLWSDSLNVLREIWRLAAA